MVCLTNLKENEWIVYSGPSNNMCHDLSKFLTCESLANKSHSITIPDGRSISVNYMGQMQLNNGIILNNVLYMPQFRFNLIDVSKIVVDMNCVITFDTNKCYFQELTNEVENMPAW